MRMATKTPSEWLRLLCRDWAQENEEIVAATDSRFLHYKSYLKGQLTLQLLCRLSISGHECPKHHATVKVDPTATNSIDFWRILGVEDYLKQTGKRTNKVTVQTQNLRHRFGSMTPTARTTGDTTFSFGTPCTSPQTPQLPRLLLIRHLAILQQNLDKLLRLGHALGAPLQQYMKRLFRCSQHR